MKHLLMIWSIGITLKLAVHNLSFSSNFMPNTRYFHSICKIIYVALKSTTDKTRSSKQAFCILKGHNKKKTPMENYAVKN